VNASDAADEMRCRVINIRTECDRVVGSRSGIRTRILLSKVDSTFVSALQ